MDEPLALEQFMHATQKPTCQCRATSNFASCQGPYQKYCYLTKVIQWELGRTCFNAIIVLIQVAQTLL